MPLTDSFLAPAGRLTNKVGRAAEAHTPMFDRHLLAKAVDSLAAQPLNSLNAAETIALVLGLDYLKSKAASRTTSAQVEQTKSQIAEQDAPAVIAVR